jgi:VWFA-related protein
MRRWVARGFRSWAAVCAVAGLVSGFAPVRTLAQEVPVAVKAEIVRLDVVVTDAQGKPIRNLAREGFEVLEDGKPQTLTHFVAIDDKQPAPPEPVVKPSEPVPASAPSPEAVAGRPGQRIVIVVDDLHISQSNLSAAREVLARFLANQVATDDQLGLVTTSSAGVALEPTLDHASVSQALSRLVSHDVAGVPTGVTRMTPGQAELILRGDRNALLLATRLLFDEPGGSYSGDTPKARTEATSGGATGGVEPEEKAAAKEAQRQAATILAETLRYSTATLNRVEDVLRALALLPGRKICLLVSEGFLVGAGTSEERTRDLRRLVDAATRSGAVVYAMEARGLVAVGGDAGVAGSTAPPGLEGRVARLSEQVLRETLVRVTSDTGGFLVQGTRDLADGLRQMLEDNQTYYLMAYQPTNTKRDGRFRKIEVRLPAHHEWTLRTRKGYLASDERGDPRRASGENGRSAPAGSPKLPPLAEAEARAALSAVAPAKGIPLRLAADYLDLPPAGPQAVVRSELEVASLDWQQKDGLRQTAVDMVGGVYDEQGNLVGSPFGRRNELSLSKAEFERAKKAGLQLQQQLPLKPGRYQIRLVARAPGGTPLASAARFLEIPDLALKKLTMSGVFLSSASTDKAQAAATGGTEPLRDAQVQRRFKRSESLYFQLYVYNPLLDDTGSSDVVLQAQIWSGEKVVAASKPQPVDFRQEGVVPLPQTKGMDLSGLATGPYQLRVVAVDRRANTTVRRDLDFTVE